MDRETTITTIQYFGFATGCLMAWGWAGAAVFFGVWLILSCIASWTLTGLKVYQEVHRNYRILQEKKK